MLHRRSLTRPALTIAAVALILVSASFNLRFGMSLGQDAVGKVAWAMASLAADLLKAMMPVVVVAALGKRNGVIAGIASLVLVVTAAFSLAAAIGFAARSRDAALQETPAYQRALERYERAERLLSTWGAARSPEMVRADIARLTALPRANGCLYVDGPVSRQVCARVTELRRELDRAERVVMARRDLETAKREMEHISARGDPQTRTLSQLLSGLLTPEQVRMGLVILSVALVELGATFGLLLASGIEGDRIPTPKKGKIAMTRPVDLMALLGTVTRMGRAVVPGITVRGEGRFLISQNRLARTLSVSRHVIRRELKRLAEAGLIAISAGPRGTMVRLAG